MKRHPSLQDLSRDHHHALVQAQRLRRSAQGEEDVAREFLQFWQQDASPHFREEEEVLLPVYARRVPPSQDEDVRKMLDDHAWFRDTVFELQLVPFANVSDETTDSERPHQARHAGRKRAASARTKRRRRRKRRR